MCINCRIITPLTDDAADLLGVPRRKYLTYGKNLYDLMLKNGKNKFGGYNNVIHNYKTLKCVSYDDRNFKPFEVNGIEIYEGKLKIISPLPLNKPPEDIDMYLELFEGEVIWAGDSKTGSCCA